MRCSIPFIALLSACATEESPNRSSASRDSAGITIVESEEALWADGEGWRVATEPSLVLGVVDGEPVYQFDRIRQIARVADGRIVVANAGSTEIRVYDAAGQHLVSMGSSGDGPGEFRTINSLTMIGDTIAVFDGGQNRLSFFDLAGSFLASVSMQPTGDPIHPLRNYRVGGVLEEALVMLVWAFPADMRPEPVTYWDTLPTLLYGRDGVLRDTVGEFGGMDTHSQPRRAGSVTFGRYSSSDVHAGLLYMTDGGRYEVRVYDPAVGLTRVIRLLREPRPVTQALIDEYTDRLVEGISDPERRREARQSRATWPHAATLPWISQVEVGERGYVWVREYQHRFDPTAPRWGVFDTDGRWLGRMEFPSGLTPHQIGEDYVIGVVRDELQVEYVRIHALTRD